MSSVVKDVEIADIYIDTVWIMISTIVHAKAEEAWIPNTSGVNRFYK